MLLSNTAIVEAVTDGRLVIEPPLAVQVSEADMPRLGPCSVDLLLGDLIQIPSDSLNITIDLSRQGNVAATLTAISRNVTLDPEAGYRLMPNRFVLGRTLERISLPLPSAFARTAAGKPCLAGRVEGKSSRARFGLLVHFTAPTIHAGWSGPITLEMMNLGPAPIMLFPGMPICQLLVEEVGGVPFESPSTFQGQVTPAGETQ